MALELFFFLIQDQKIGTYMLTASINALFADDYVIMLTPKYSN
jgi:hypothetical protein